MFMDDDIDDACKMGNLNRFIELYPQNANIKNEYGQSLLDLACTNGQLEIVNFLINHEDEITNINDVDKFGSTPLHKAVLHGHFEIVKILLAHGANLNLKDNSGNSELHNASTLDLCEEIIKFLVSHGSNINDKNIGGNTPFIIASCNGNLGTLKLLVELGLQTESNPMISNIINAKNLEGKTALHYASSRGFTSIVDWLLQIGCDQLSTDNDGHTAIDLANNENIVNVFMEYNMQMIKEPE